MNKKEFIETYTDKDKDCLSFPIKNIWTGNYKLDIPFSHLKWLWDLRQAGEIELSAVCPMGARYRLLTPQLIEQQSDGTVYTQLSLF